MKYCDILKLAFFENYKKYKKENFKHLFNFLISCQFFSSFFDQEKKNLWKVKCLLKFSTNSKALLEDFLSPSIPLNNQTIKQILQEQG